MASPSSPMHETAVEIDDTWKHDLNEELKNCNWEGIERLIHERQSEAFKIRLNDNKDTVLLSAFKGGKKGLFLISSLVDRIPTPDLLAETDKYGNTALHLAATVGLVEHAKKLVEKNHQLLNIPNNDELLPIELALGRDPANARRMISYLSGVMKGAADARVMRSLAQAGFYEIAFKLVEHNPELMTWEEVVDLLHPMALDPDGFPSTGRPLDFWKSLIYSLAYIYVPTDRTGMTDPPCAVYKMLFWKVLAKVLGKNMIGHMDVSTDTVNEMTESPYGVHKMLFWKVVAKVLVNEDIPELKLKHHYALKLLKSLCSKLTSSSESESSILSRTFLIAAHNGIEEIVKEILDHVPTAMNYIDYYAEQRSVFHIAVMYRRENILKIAHDKNMEHKGMYVQNLDYRGNNILHMVGYKPFQAGIDTDSGSIFQMQSELQWFKKVTELVTHQESTSNNAYGKKPFTLFEEQHADMAAKEKEWMSAMATASSVAASLVAAVAFAAAFQVPGGNSGNGIPNFSNETSFIVFAISDALALFSSITSVLSFLSVFTSRYGLRDHLHVLPHRVIIGLISLLLAFVFLTIAFSSTLYLVFAKKNVLTLIPIITVSCIPVILYVKLQLPSLIAMIKSTVCPSILRRPW